MYRVAIVGRPNVGKSTLFNRLTRTRKAIVSNEPGITRDRLFEIASWDGKQFEVIDTGGLLPGEKEVIPAKILLQAEIAIQQADLLVFVVDARDGITPVDETLNSFLRSHGKEYLLVVNKVDVPRMEDDALQFHALGVEKVFPVSAEHKTGIGDLLEQILQRIPTEEKRHSEDEIRVAIIGRPNVGKSSLLNRFLGTERSIVTDIPGTTRDAVDSILELDGETFRLIDTAGIRRQGKTELKAEKLSVVMARKHLERADVVLLVLDATAGVAKLDATIGGYAEKAGKSLIVVVNKWDLLERDAQTAAHLEKEFRSRLRFLDFAPLIFVSARTGQRVMKILELAHQAAAARRLRIPTGELNRFVGDELQARVASSARSRKAPIKYAAQVSVSPPTFVFFTRLRKGLHFSVRRFLTNRLREQYGFFATPIRLIERRAARARRQLRNPTEPRP